MGAAKPLGMLPSIPRPVRSTQDDATLGRKPVFWRMFFPGTPALVCITPFQRVLTANFEVFIAMPFRFRPPRRNLRPFVVISCVAEGPVGPLCVFGVFAWAKTNGWPIRPIPFQPDPYT